MHGIARAFLVSSVVYGILGMLLGLKMGISGDHGQMPTHAHMMVLGWLSFAVFAVLYHLLSDRIIRMAGIAHLVIAQISAIVMLTLLFLIHNGNSALDPAAGIASIGYFISFAAFAIAAWPAMTAKREG